MISGTAIEPIAIIPMYVPSSMPKTPGSAGSGVTRWSNVRPATSSSPRPTPRDEEDGQGDDETGHDAEDRDRRAPDEEPERQRPGESRPAHERDGRRRPEDAADARRRRERAGLGRARADQVDRDDDHQHVERALDERRGADQRDARDAAPRAPPR